ncbi:hypothetical protein LguiA_018402 [Lonicera macranthoides]
MARLLPFHHRPAIASQASFAIGTLFLCALALFMCASHSRKWRRWRASYVCRNRDPVIQLNNEGMMVQGFQFENGDPSTYSGGEVSVWQKNIIMGGKCQLPDFSGVIIYDSAGNIVQPAKGPHALPWK